MKPLLTLILLLNSIVSYQQTIIPANNNLIKYSGRINFENANAPVFSYSGVRIRTYFTGTSVSVKFSNSDRTTYFYAIVNNNKPIKLAVGVSAKTYLIANNLPNGIHSIELVALNECIWSRTTFHGFELDEAATLYDSVFADSHKIEFIGNSYTCGYGNEGGDFVPETQIFYKTYACITARNFNADYLTVCRSGIGMYHNNGDQVADSKNSLPKIYTNIIHDRGPVWNFNNYQPNIICINLGINDFSVNGGDTAKFKAAYNKFIDTLTIINPTAKIIAILMDSRAIVDSSIRQVVRYQNNKGNNNIYFINQSQSNSNIYGSGTHGHPSLGQHAKYAGELTNFIKQITGWNALPNAINAQVASTSQVNLFLSDNTDTVILNKGLVVTLKGINYKPDSIMPYNNQTGAYSIFLNTNIQPFDTVLITFPDSAQNTNNKQLLPFYDLKVDNKLQPFTITKFSANDNGNILTITANRVAKTLTLNGFIITNATGAEIEIDSSKNDFTGKLLFVYVKQTIYKGDTLYLSYTGSTAVSSDNIYLKPFSNTKLFNYSKITKTGVQNIFNNATFNVYPNPAKNVLFVNSNTIVKANILICNSIGNVIINQIITLPGTINTTGLTNGNYVLQILPFNGNSPYRTLISINQ